MAITCRQPVFPTCYGKEFTDRLFGLRKRAATGLHEFDTLCAALEIDHRLTPPKSPQTNGMVERFNGRIEEVLQSHHFRSGEELEATIHRYVWLYNQQLPQSALSSKSPLQAMKAWHKIRDVTASRRSGGSTPVTMRNQTVAPSALTLPRVFFRLRTAVRKSATVAAG